MQHTSAPSCYCLLPWRRQVSIEYWVCVEKSASFYILAFPGTLEIDKADLEVLYKCPDRPNIYSQRRMLKKPVDVMYVYKITFNKNHGAQIWK